MKTAAELHYESEIRTLNAYAHFGKLHCPHLHKVSSVKHFLNGKNAIELFSRLPGNLTPQIYGLKAKVKIYQKNSRLCSHCTPP